MSRASVAAQIRRARSLSSDTRGLYFALRLLSSTWELYTSRLNLSSYFLTIPKARNLVERLRDYSAWVLRFVHDFRVPLTNSAAERDLRMMKVQQKISGTFRSVEGAVAFCRIRSYIATSRKMGLNVIESLSSVFNGEPLLHRLLQTT